MDKLTKSAGKGSNICFSFTKLVKRAQKLDESTKTFNSFSELIELLETKEKILKNHNLEEEELINYQENYRNEFEKIKRL